VHFSQPCFRVTAKAAVMMSSRLNFISGIAPPFNNACYITAVIYNQALFSRFDK
jgi:hypothetical protein